MAGQSSTLVNDRDVMGDNDTCVIPPSKINMHLTEVWALTWLPLMMGILGNTAG